MNMTRIFLCLLFSMPLFSSGNVILGYRHDPYWPQNELVSAAEVKTPYSTGLFSLGGLEVRVAQRVVVEGVLPNHHLPGIVLSIQQIRSWEARVLKPIVRLASPEENAALSWFQTTAAETNPRKKIQYCIFDRDDTGDRIVVYYSPNKWFNYLALTRPAFAKYHKRILLVPFNLH